MCRRQSAEGIRYAHSLPISFVAEVNPLVKSSSWREYFSVACDSAYLTVAKPQSEGKRYLILPTSPPQLPSFLQEASENVHIYTLRDIWRLLSPKELIHC